ncbi:fibronectin type III domain-containing protein [Bacillus licheniformis]|uniref:fibronectin type III domain-containing protein n=1 Tax=Bacillus licheniformis TaxID=1402 RepID=UPI00237CE975|nr:fibronectin type III domain-containing protein [Bacillus licheniformis]MDE1437588.1 fibronectin type III domain-containing protein [Bacillus licheniformis]MEC1243959.1 fibronectin type III domain-containing protein [Bacillus licheniformis]MEC1326544.1 fibronectin type III domain-containing protein [Bacillus licheniformis]
MKTGLRKFTNQQPLLPNAPQNLRYDSTTDSITVEWDPVDGATSYNVYRGADKKFAENVTQPKYVTTGMSPDTKLTINVTAANESGESPMSEIVTQTKMKIETES